MLVSVTATDRAVVTSTLTHVVPVSSGVATDTLHAVCLSGGETEQKTSGNRGTGAAAAQNVPIARRSDGAAVGAA